MPFSAANWFISLMNTVAFTYVGQRCARLRKHSLQVSEYLMRLLLDAAFNELAFRVKRNLAGRKQQIAKLDRLRIGSDGAGAFVRS